MSPTAGAGHTLTSWTVPGSQRLGCPSVLGWVGGVCRGSLVSALIANPQPGRPARQSQTGWSLLHDNGLVAHLPIPLSSVFPHTEQRFPKFFKWDIRSDWPPPRPRVIFLLWLHYAGKRADRKRRAADLPAQNSGHPQLSHLWTSSEPQCIAEKKNTKRQCEG